MFFSESANVLQVGCHFSLSKSRNGPAMQSHGTRCLLVAAHPARNGRYFAEGRVDRSLTGRLQKNGK